MFAFLLSPITRYAAIGLAILAAVTGIYLKGRSDGKETMRPKLEAAQSAADNWKQAADNRKTLIEAQNRAVAALKAENEARISDIQKKLAVANSEASKIRRQATDSATAILTMKVTGTECQQLEQLIDEARK